MEELLLLMDKYDSKHGNQKFLMSRIFDLERGSPPSLWPKSRMELIKDLEKACLEYGIVIYGSADNVL